ncbi:MAG TPA: T9SS type A sorting domain-containing protein [Ignavibacteriaceae bacterium]|nr:T9SS type A sorting domain-containing protein [Ignavibacteriaceae bacterium]
MSVMVLTCFSNSYAQLEIFPKQIEYKSRFERLQNVYFINTGSQNISIDTIYYKSNLYTVRFDSYNHYPLSISPGDTLKMDCILSGYFYVTQSDSTDSLTVVINSLDSAAVNVKIDFYETLKTGTISGNVTSNQVLVPDAEVKFYLNGTHLLKSVYTDINGDYSIELPVGLYKISAQKESYELLFHDLKDNPLEADGVIVTESSNDTVNFDLKPKISTGVSLSGKIYDQISAAPINRGIVVIRRGRHTPSKILGSNNPDTYSTQINYDGTYNFDDLTAGYYYIQVFSDYFIPTYFDQDNTSEFYWQNGDSVNISGSLSNYNITMSRDSSFGGGSISGKVSIGGTGSNRYSDVMVYAQSVPGSLPFNYSFVDSSGNYSIKDLPYGTYRILAQKIGYPDALSNGSITIDTNSFEYSKINILIVSGIAEGNSIPEDFVLFQNYPNPFNPATTIKFIINKTSFVNLRIINTLGQEVAQIYNRELSPGDYKISFSAGDLSSGIYFIALRSDDNLMVKKMILLK